MKTGCVMNIKWDFIVMCGDFSKDKEHLILLFKFNGGCTASKQMHKNALVTLKMVFVSVRVSL